MIAEGDFAPRTQRANPLPSGAGAVRPGGRLAWTLYSKPGGGDSRDAQGNNDPYNYDAGVQLGYRGLQRKDHPEAGNVQFLTAQKNAFDLTHLLPFGFGLNFFPDGITQWDKILELKVNALDLDVRGIHFCVQNNYRGMTPDAVTASPDAVVQFYAKQQQRDYLELLTFRKIRSVMSVAADATKPDPFCRIAFFDPVSYWKGDKKTGKFVDLDFKKGEWELHYSFNGVTEAKPVESIGGNKDLAAAAQGTGGKKYETLKDYFAAYKERQAAEHALGDLATGGTQTGAMNLGSREDQPW
eukprot:g20534.t1